MPIRPENRARYGTDWIEFSHRIRFERAGGRCECEGECGMPGHRLMPGRCENRHGDRSFYTGSKVVLTVAHLNHRPEERGEGHVPGVSPLVRPRPPRRNPCRPPGRHTEGDLMTDLSNSLPIGTPVLAYPGVRPDDPLAEALGARVLDTVTRSDVWTVGGTLVVKVEGHAGGIALTHIDRKEHV